MTFKKYCLLGLASLGLVLAGIWALAQSTAYERAEADSEESFQWWPVGSDRKLAAVSEYSNDWGSFRLVNAQGVTDTEDHPFFTAIGGNDRACVTCHQPQDAMGLSAETARQLWEATEGEDPLFAAVDGSNCPHLPQDEKASHSLLLEYGLIRMALPWPPEGVETEFSIEVVRDPTGCNTHPVYGLESDKPKVSVYRRPRPLINTRHLTTMPEGVPPHDKFLYTDKSLLAKDPETGEFVTMQLMSDGSGLTLRHQSRRAAESHLEKVELLSDPELKEVADFISELYGAQGRDPFGADLDGAGTPPGLGPQVLVEGPAAELGNNPINRVFGDFSIWRDIQDAELSEEARAFRDSVARGADIFYLRRFMIQDVAGMNDRGLGNPFHRSCGSGCHNTTLMGMDLAPGFMDLGLNNRPWANNRPDLPLFRIVCDADADPHPYLGREIYSHDPGRALITGKCKHVGLIMTQQMRGLAARAPYFANGSAKTLREMVDFYDRRFNIGYTEQEKRDLVNFMGVL